MELLPKWLFLVGTMALYNSIQSFIPSMRLTPKIYAKQPLQVTSLMSRMMGTWTFTSAIIRLYASFYIQDPIVYQLCFWTFLIAFLSFTSEVFIYQTAPLSSPGVYPAMIVSSLSMIWMWFAYSHYVILYAQF